MLNMTKNFCVSAVNRLIRPFFVFMRCRLSHPVIPSVAEESRGNACSACSYRLALSKVAERGGATAPERGLLPDFSQKLFNKDKGNYKTSILFSLNFASLNSASFPASWGSQGVVYKLARKSRLLGKARPYYLIVPLPYTASARCFDSASLAQHDKKLLRKCR